MNPRRTQQNPKSQQEGSPALVPWVGLVRETGRLEDQASSRQGASPLQERSPGPPEGQKQRGREHQTLLGKGRRMVALFLQGWKASFPCLLHIALTPWVSRGPAVLLPGRHSIRSTAPLLPQHAHSCSKELLVTKEQAQLFPTQGPRGRRWLDLGHPEVAIYKLPDKHNLPCSAWATWTRCLSGDCTANPPRATRAD